MTGQSRHPCRVVPLHGANAANCEPCEFVSSHSARERRFENGNRPPSNETRKLSGPAGLYMRNTTYSINKSKIILTSVIFFVAAEELSSQQFGPPPMSPGPYAAPSDQTAPAGQPYLQGPPMI